MVSGATSFELTLDLVDHTLVARTGEGVERSFTLHDGLSLAAFHERLFELLGSLGIDVVIRPEPFGVPITTLFPEDVEHASYDRDAVERYWRALAWSDWILREFAGWFTGKTSPVHVFWHSFDLALTRFSGRRAPALPGADEVTREAHSHEAISFGFWAGDAQVRRPAFYSYAAPEPAGLSERPLAEGRPG